MNRNWQIRMATLDELWHLKSWLVDSFLSYPWCKQTQSQLKENAGSQGRQARGAEWVGCKARNKKDLNFAILDLFQRAKREMSIMHTFKSESDSEADSQGDFQFHISSSDDVMTPTTLSIHTFFPFVFFWMEGMYICLAPRQIFEPSTERKMFHSSYVCTVWSRVLC